MVQTLSNPLPHITKQETQTPDMFQVISMCRALTPNLLREFQGITELETCVKVKRHVVQVSLFCFHHLMLHIWILVNSKIVVKFCLI